MGNKKLNLVAPTLMITVVSTLTLIVGTRLSLNLKSQWFGRSITHLDG